MDDVELLEVDDDYYAFLNLSRDVSVVFGLFLFESYAFHNSSTELRKLSGHSGANQCFLQAPIEGLPP